MPQNKNSTDGQSTLSTRRSRVRLIQISSVSVVYFSELTTAMNATTVFVEK